MIDDWGYVNARVRALKGRLLGAAAYAAALDAPTLEDLVSFLEGTPYAAAIDAALSARPGIAGLEEGLRRDFQRTIDGVVRCAGGRPRELLELALGRWELFNVRTVLRALHARAGPEAVLASAIPFGRLDDVALAELARQADVRGGIDLLGQWRIPYAAALRAAYPDYARLGDLAALETALDRGFFAAALRGLDRTRVDEAIVSDCLRRELDRILVGYALRAMHHGAAAPAPAAVFVPGGRLVTLPVFERLCAARALADFLAALPPGRFAACFAEAARSLPHSPRPSTLDRAARVCFLRGMTRLVAGDPLSAALPVGYLWRKATEVENLRVIARGVSARLPRAGLEAMLLGAE